MESHGLFIDHIGDFIRTLRHRHLPAHGFRIRPGFYNLSYCFVCIQGIYIFFITVACTVIYDHIRLYIKQISAQLNGFPSIFNRTGFYYYTGQESGIMKNIIKKALSVCMVLLAALPLCSCKSEELIPDAVLKQKVIQILNNYYYEDYQSIDCVVHTHEQDKENHTDKVFTEVHLKNEYGEIVIPLTGVFQYHRADDLWGIVSFSDPTKNNSWTVDEDKILGQYEGAGVKGDLNGEHEKVTHSFDVLELDMPNFQMTLSGTLDYEQAYILADHLYGPYNRQVTISDSEPCPLQNVYRDNPTPVYAKCFYTDLKTGISYVSDYPIRIVLSLKDGIYVMYPAEKSWRTIE